MITYLMHSGAWSLAGFLLGWMLGVIGRHAQEGRTMPSHQQPPRPRSARDRGFIVERVAGIALVVLAAVTLITAAVSARQLQTVTECQTRYNVQLGHLLDNRSASAVKLRDAQREFITALAAPDAGFEDQATKDAFLRYRAALDADAANRQRNPVPDPPNCG